MIATHQHELTDDEVLHDEIGSMADYPLEYVMFNYPWGEKGTDLENFKGPRKWQKKFLIELGKQIRASRFDRKTSVKPIRFSTASGHGIGKSALTAWLIQFLIDTRKNSCGTVTSNTRTQLKTKTWGELSKWHSMSITEHWTSYHASPGNMALINKLNPGNWRVDAYTCDKENSEAFAGQHEVSSSSYYIFDEASAIPEKIFEVAEGGLTDGEPFMFLFGNPTRNSGAFHETHHGKKHRWTRYQIDSRAVEGASNPELIAEWEEDWGEDSDFFRVRVRGIFPNSASTQYISSALVFAAQKREMATVRGAPLVMGVDVARFGDDKSVIVVRHGRDFRTFKKREFRGEDTVALANFVIEYRDDLARQGHCLDAIFVDGDGVGGGVVDTLVDKGVRHVYEVNHGSAAQKSKRYANKRMEIYARLKGWLKGACLPEKDTELGADLCNLEYGFENGSHRLLLESKKSMKARGLASPDDSDALALTFAEHITARDRYPNRGKSGGNKAETECNIYAL